MMYIQAVRLFGLPALAVPVMGSMRKLPTSLQSTHGQIDEVQDEWLINDRVDTVHLRYT
jgi:hypothetical protein